MVQNKGGSDNERAPTACNGRPTRVAEWSAMVRQSKTTGRTGPARIWRVRQQDRQAEARGTQYTQA